ncbi:MAG TPA: type II toxin-antitoxin system VapC family toxin [Ramlibacter sp.]|nr:type II toxin-antitoxin system VapC family toxin [Ramlibacter sp.]
MILVDTSVWVDHLRKGDARLAELLERGAVVMHPLVVGEIACGSLAARSSILELLQDLPMAVVAENTEVLDFIENRSLFGRGLGYVDAHLLVSTALTDGASLWTRDKRLQEVAEGLDCSYPQAAAH